MLHIIKKCAYNIVGSKRKEKNMIRFQEDLVVNGVNAKTIYEVEENKDCIPSGIKVKIYFNKLRVGCKFFKNEENETLENIEKALIAKGARKLEKGE